MVSMPPSKSAAHRAIICAALARGKSTIFPVDFSNDIKATTECMKFLGADIEFDGEKLTVDGTVYTYSLYITATDNPIYRLPETGGNGFRFFPIGLFF